MPSLDIPITYTHIPPRAKPEKNKGTWSKPRRWSGKGFRQSRKLLKRAISRKSWLDKAVCGDDPFTYNKVEGFYQFTITVDQKKSKLTRGRKFSTDTIIRSFVARAEKEFAGVVVFDVGKAGLPHMHGFVAVPTARKFEQLMNLLDTCRVTFGEEVDWGKLYTPEDLGAWIGYTLQNKPWHGNLPPLMEQKFGRYRGMASVFGHTPEVDNIAIRIGNCGDVVVEIPDEVITATGEVIKLPMTTTGGWDKTSRIDHIAHYGTFGFGVLLAAAANTLMCSSLTKIEKRLGMDRLADRHIISLLQATFINDPTTCAAMAYNQLFEIRGTRVFKSVESVLHMGGMVELTVDGKAVPSSLDRSLFGVNFRPLKDGKSLI